MCDVRSKTKQITRRYRHLSRGCDHGAGVRAGFTLSNKSYEAKVYNYKSENEGWRLS